MATSIPNWLLGRDITTVTIRYQVADSAGVLGNGSSTLKTLTTIIDAIEFSSTDEDEEISALTSQYEHFVSIRTSDQLTLTQIMIAADGLNSLAEIWMNAEAGGDFAVASFLRGGTNGIALTGTFSNYRESIRQGKSVAMLDLLVVDTFDTGVPSANAAYTT